MTEDNAAAWLPSRRARLRVGPAPHPIPGSRQVVVRNRAVAINPIDWIVQLSGPPIYPWIRREAILGHDVAGDVVSVGSEVTRFRVGDRVLGHAIGTEKSVNAPAQGAFQLLTVLDEHLSSPIPDFLGYEHAAVIPLGLSTAACGLFQRHQLRLAHPVGDPRPLPQTLLVWGGATSVGTNAIQLARAAGYRVIATCSPHNDEFVLGLGATGTFDYRAPSVVVDITAALRGRQAAGALALGHGSAQLCLEVLGRCEGRRFVSQAATPISFAPLADHPHRLALLVTRFAAGMARANASALLKRARLGFISGASLADDEVGPLIYRDYLPAALADGRFRAALPPRVIGHGLEHIQAGLDAQRAGVSAEKIVVTL